MHYKCEVWYLSIFGKSVEKVQVLWKSDKNNSSTLHEAVYTFMTISRPVLLRMRNVSDKSCRKNQNKHFMFGNFYFENHAVCERMWENTVESDRPQMIIWRMRVACWITKTTDTHSEYVMVIVFSLQEWTSLFSMQEWLHERASLLSYR